MNQYILYAIIIVGIFTAYMAIVHLVRGDEARARLKSAGGGGFATDEDMRSFFGTICENILSLFGVKVAEQKDLALELAQAGIRSPHAVAYALFFKRVVQPVMVVLGALLLVKMMISTDLSTLNRMFDLLLAMLLLTAGLFGTKLYVTNRRQHRQQVLLRSFPEVLDLLLVCIESGLGLDAALARAGSELQATHPVVAAELDRTRMELTVLPDRTQALQNFADRAMIVPFKSLVAALIQTEKFGTSLVDTLRVLSDDQRTARLLDAENRAARLPVLVTIPLILCFLPAFIMIILGPPFIKVINQGGIFGSSTP